MVEPLILFLVALAVAAGVVMVLARNPINSAFALVGLMLTLAAIYAVIGAHFVAALQAIVYAGAVMVLFVFSIMLLNMNEEKSEINLHAGRTYVGVSAALVLFGFFAYAFIDWSKQTQLPAAGPWTLDFIKSHGGNVVTLSGTLFSKNYLQFEVISLLLLVAMAAALVLAKRKVD